MFAVGPGAVAEPGTLALAGLALGLSGWVSVRRRREAAARSR
ncbi:PEP-CTERM sorting domain-containing protein [Azohydromonas australica]|nr:PEP-CTERM sorting domain-containing protein [Azohydromonas australica]